MLRAGVLLSLLLFPALSLAAPIAITSENLTRFEQSSASLPYACYDAGSGADPKIGRLSTPTIEVGVSTWKGLSREGIQSVQSRAADRVRSLAAKLRELRRRKASAEKIQKALDRLNAQRDFKKNFRAAVRACAQFNPDPAPSGSPSEETPDIKLTALIRGLDQPIYMTHAHDGTGRIFIVERAGKIQILENKTSLRTTPFLNIESKVGTDGEGGLLGIAFPLDYSTTRKFYVHYTDAGGDNVVAEYQTLSGDANVADSGSERVLLNIDQSNDNHKGGQIEIGPDGYLYIGFGDGGGGGDPEESGQDPLKLKGKILRIDPTSGSPYSIPATNPFKDTAGFRGEVWALGMRNPWRFSFDTLTGELYVGDVGQDKWEEVDIITKGANYGWNTMEGEHCYDPATGCDRTGLTLPIHEYAHPTDGASVTGGYVYRGTQFTNLYGKYIYGDYVTGEVWVLRPNGDGTFTNRSVYQFNTYDLFSFGQDADGELYIIGGGGTIWHIVENS